MSKYVVIGGTLHLNGQRRYITPHEIVEALNLNPDECELHFDAQQSPRLNGRKLLRPADAFKTQGVR